MVEGSSNIVEHLVDWDIGVFPREDDTGGHILENCSCNLTCRLIQDVRKMVFTQHTVCWVTALGVGPWFVLVFSTCIDDGRTTGLELFRNGIDDRAYERRQKRENEHC